MWIALLLVSFFGRMRSSAEGLGDRSVDRNISDWRSNWGSMCGRFGMSGVLANVTIRVIQISHKSRLSKP